MEYLSLNLLCLILGLNSNINHIGKTICFILFYLFIFGVNILNESKIFMVYGCRIQSYFTEYNTL